MPGRQSPELTYAQLRAERDLFRDLCLPGAEGNPKSRLAGALRLACDAVGAEKGYLAIFRKSRQLGDRPIWWTQIGLTDDERAVVHHRFSSTVISDSLKRRQVMMLPSALGHPKYLHAESVRVNQITSVLCAPIGPAGRGIIYLQGKREGGIFRPKDEIWLTQLANRLDAYVKTRALTNDEAEARDDFHDAALPGLLGSSEVIQSVRDDACTFLRQHHPLLIQGPRGCGKTTVANTLAIRCAPTSHLLELRGHRLLALADTLDQLQADEGPLTLIVEDIGTLHAAGQHELLRILKRLKCPTLCTRDTSNPLVDELAHFFADHTLHLPRLAERLEDIPAIALSMAAQRQQDHGLPAPPFREGDLSMLVAEARHADLYELQTMVEDLVTLNLTSSSALLLSHSRANGSQQNREPEDGSPPLLSLREARDAFTRRYLQDVLKRCDGRVSMAAKCADISRSRIYALLEKHGLLGVGRNE